MPTTGAASEGQGVWRHVACRFLLSAAVLVLAPSVAIGQPPACDGTSVVFGFTGAAANFVVPVAVTQVTVDAAGAEGGGVSTLRGGGGARLVATFAVTSGETLHVVVGGMGSTAFPQLVGGGGGGSFVYRTADAAGLLIAAAGGGGAGSCGPGIDGSATTAANGQGSQGGTGGTAGIGGNGGGEGSGVACTGAGGGGLLTNGGNSASCAATGGQALANGAGGGAGGGTGGSGGFGGGGGGGQIGDSEGGGGGGGFDGGGGGAKTLGCGAAGSGIAAGGGGGSFSASAPSFSQSGAHTGNGQVSFCYTPVVNPPITEVPTLSELGLLIASLLLAALGAWRLRTG